MDLLHGVDGGGYKDRIHDAFSQHIQDVIQKTRTSVSRRALPLESVKPLVLSEIGGCNLLLLQADD